MLFVLEGVVVPSTELLSGCRKEEEDMDSSIGVVGVDVAGEESSKGLLGLGFMIFS